MKQKTTTHIVNVASIAFLCMFPHFVPLPFYSYTIVCLVLIYLMLKRKHRSFDFIGLKQSGISKKSVSIGVLSAVIWVAFNQWMYIPFIKYYFVVPDYTEYDFIRENISTLIITLFAACLVGGFYEEIVFRGFIQRTFERIFKNNFWVSAIFTSTLFGLYHFQQGIFGMIPSFFGALFWSYLLKKSNGNLWVTIFSHATFDIITLLLIYFGLFG
jgi:membrane protease YdiL (CAAX protease family)